MIGLGLNVISSVFFLVLLSAAIYAQPTAPELLDPKLKILNKTVEQLPTSASVVISNKRKNSKYGLVSPYVLLISIDGFRWDYVDLHQPKFLSQFARQSASLSSLRPSYPSKTYPNHISIVTGLYPQNHGIVANHFIDRETKPPMVYGLADRNSVEEGRFYKGISIWGLAEQAGIKTASYYWPGSETNNANYQPSYYLYYQHNRPHRERIDTVEEWFTLPELDRPHFVSLYFHEVDSAGHHYGPGSKQVKAAIDKVDASIQTIVEKLEHLDIELNIIIVSDHGMADIVSSKTIELPKLDGFSSFGQGPLVQYYIGEHPESSKTTEQGGRRQHVDYALTQLNQAATHFSCSRPKHTDKMLNIQKATRLGDIVCLADRGWSLYSTKPRAGGLKQPNHVSPGNHGWSQFQGRDMHGIFYARGPLFKSNVQIPTVNNVDIYPLIAQLYGLSFSHPIDGQLDTISPLLAP